MLCLLIDGRRSGVKSWAEASIMGIILVGKTSNEGEMLVEITAAVRAVIGLKIF